jgi:hypothetical protein
MSDRSVRPETITIAISDGDWLRVKKRLNAGEQRQMIRRGLVDADAVRYDLIAAGLGKICAFLVDWSLTPPITGPDAIPLAAALDVIDPDTYTEILRTIEGHEHAMAAERAAQKKIPAGATPSSPPSPSPAPAASPTSGSSS